MAGGEDQIIPCPSYFKAHTRSHQPTMSPSPQSQKSTKPKGRQQPKLQTQGKGHFVWAPPKAVPGDLQPQCPAVTPTTMSQCWSTFWTEWGDCLGVWDTSWHAGEERLGIVQDLLSDV